MASQNQHIKTFIYKKPIARAPGVTFEQDIRHQMQLETDREMNNFERATQDS